MPSSRASYELVGAQKPSCPDLANGLFDYDTHQHVLH